MTFIVTKASDKNYRKEIEIKDLQQLISKAIVEEQDLVIYRPRGNGYWELKLYDTFVEK